MLATIAENSKHIFGINDDQQTVADLIALSAQNSELVKEVAILQY